MALLNVEKLSVHFGDEKAPFRAVDRISYQVEQGQVVGIVGESGSGKSVSSLAIMGLIDYPGRVKAEKLEFNQRDLQRISEKRAPPAGGRRSGDDLPGPDDQPQPVLHRGLPDHGSAESASGRQQAHAASACHRPAGAGGHSRIRHRGSMSIRISCPAV